MGILALSAGSGCSRGEPAAAGREIRAMLRSSAESWNAGDLDGFLDDYAADGGLTFVGAGGPIRGREEVRRRYVEGYWAPGSERDSLRFEDVEVRPLGPGHALAVGRYVLYRPGASPETTSTGWFTLVLAKQDSGWAIVHDHSSAEE